MTTALLSPASHTAALPHTPHPAPDIPNPHRPSAPKGNARPPKGNAGAQIAPALPAAFEAFRALHSPCYLGYAQLHLPPHDATDAVAHTLGHLLTHWPQVVSRLNPAAHAWQQLVTCTASRHHPLPLSTTSPQQYDTVLLHHALGYPLPAIADTTGLHPTKVNYLSRSWHPDLAIRSAARPSPVVITTNSRI